MADAESDPGLIRTWIRRELKYTVLGLLAVMVPVVFVWKALEHAHAVVSGGVTNVAPGVERVGGVEVAIWIVLALILVCWILGRLVTLTVLGRRVRGWERAKFAARSPLVQKYEEYTGTLSEDAASASPAVQPALARIAGDWQPGAVVEEQEGGWGTVFVPEIPDLAKGRLYCLPSEQILRLEIPLEEFKQKLTTGGHGSQDWLQAVASRA